MTCLIDTGILLRLVNRNDPEHMIIRRALRELKETGVGFAVTSQNLIEFWNVSTRPTSARGGYGLSIEVTEQTLRLLERLFPILPDAPSTHAEWKRLVVEHTVKGVQVHDARLVAMMSIHDVSDVLTLNADDFRRFDRITVLTPPQVIGRARM